MFNFFKNFIKLFKSEERSKFLTFRIECDKCKEIVKVVVNLETDLMNQYKEKGEKEPAYKLKKEVLGSDCPNLMELNVEFDKNYNILLTEVKFGKLIKYNVGKF